MKLAGVVLLAGVTLNQLLPDVTEALTLDPPLPDDPILNVCDEGGVVPIV